MGRPSKSQKQDNDYILQMVRKFKSNGDQDALKEIIRHLDGFLQHLAYKKFFYIAGSGNDDIYQEALVALSTKAIPDYDEKKGSFVCFAKLCIRRHIITILKSANAIRNVPLNGAVSLDATVCHDDEDGPITIAGFLPDNSERIMDRMVRRESHNRLKRTLQSCLTPLEAVILALYLKNMSYVEIVEVVNYKRRGKRRIDCRVVDNALCRIKKKALKLEQALRKGEKVSLPSSKEDEENEELG